ncbi:uncharacterized protein LOC123876011 [Maniola jurtina]|uniref:uncharacterized protein LOC123867153 n=1 Tax=Maniola jurtina TaxID=191418 RepID=UPI001E68F4B3|nr:uncharacterized protein LOC123867153 [Maniola jurtina]XP_045778106.1 uncharacterized protein LOC123876011 [Maniola jurtina]
MENEMGIPPLLIRRKYLAYKYCIKAQSWRDNGIVNSLDKLSNVGESRYWLNKKKPLLAVTYGETKTEAINSSKVMEMFTLKSWISNIKYDDIIIINLKCVNKCKRSYEINSLKYEVMREINNTYSGFYKVYTDGSKSESGTGAAIYDPSRISHKIFKVNNEHISILTTELIAIFEALKYILEIDVRKAVIFTDSKSALQHIIRCTKGCSGISIAYSILSIIQDCRDKGFSIKFQWIPSHIGLSGNEEADRLANLALLNGKNYNIEPHYTEVFSKFKIICFKNWDEYFNERSLDKGIWYRTIQSEPPRIPWFVNSKII